MIIDDKDFHRTPQFSAPPGEDEKLPRSSSRYCEAYSNKAAVCVKFLTIFGRKQAIISGIAVRILWSRDQSIVCRAAKLFTEVNGRQRLFERLRLLGERFGGTSG
jgi:hypothetical protein